MVELKELVKQLCDKHVDRYKSIDDSTIEAIEQLKRQFDKDFFEIQHCVFNSYLLAEKKLCDKNDLAGKPPDLIFKGFNSLVFAEYEVQISKLTGVTYGESKDFIDRQLTDYLTKREVWYNVGLRYNEFIEEKKDRNVISCEIALKLKMNVGKVFDIIEQDCSPTLSIFEKASEEKIKWNLTTPYNLAGLINYNIVRGYVKSGRKLKRGTTAKDLLKIAALYSKRQPLSFVSSYANKVI